MPPSVVVSHHDHSSSQLSGKQHPHAHTARNSSSLTNCSGQHGSRSNHLMLPKMCPRHRVPSVGSSEAGGNSYPKSNELFGYKNRKSRRSRSYLSTSEVASSVDLNEFRHTSTSFFLKRKKQQSSSSAALKYNLSSSAPNRPNTTGSGNGFGKNNANAYTAVYKKSSHKSSKSTGIIIPETNESIVASTANGTSGKHISYPTSNAIHIGSGNPMNSLLNRVRKENANRVHFSLANTDDEDSSSVVDSVTGVPDSSNAAVDKLSVSNETFDADKLFKQALSSKHQQQAAQSSEEDDDDDEDTYHSFTRHSSNLKSVVDDVEMTETTDTNEKENSDANRTLLANNSSNLLFSLEESKLREATNSTSEVINLNCEGKKSSIEWENYWDNLEFNALGKLNI